MVYRMQDMTPENSSNLERFIHDIERAGRYRIAPASFAPIPTKITYKRELSIEKKRLRIVPAWQIGLNDPASGALGGVTDPVIPPDVTEAPILKTLERNTFLKKNSSYNPDLRKIFNKD